MIIPIVPQHVDPAKSARDYTALDGNLLVTSWFATIQGEGPYAGYPAMFVRLAGCNYGDKKTHCNFCDTSFEFSKGVEYTPSEILERLLQEPEYNANQVLVITGGEPTLQYNLWEFIKLAQKLFKDIQIETNGTQPKFFEMAKAKGLYPFRDYFQTVVSPKPNLQTKTYAKISAIVLEAATCIKYVMSADETSPHYTIPEWALSIAIPVYVSPMAVYLKAYDGEVSSIWDDDLIDKVSTSINYNYAALYAMKHQVLLSLQTHLFIGLA